MRLFRSEEHVRKEYDAPGAIFSATTLWRLAQAWYRDRLERGWRARDEAAAQEILTGVGLSDDFWRLST